MVQDGIQWWTLANTEGKEWNGMEGKGREGKGREGREGKKI